MSKTKRIIILLAFISAFVFSFLVIKGFMKIVVLFILFPLFFFYCPLIFAGEEKQEQTDEAKREAEGKFYKWQ